MADSLVELADTKRQTGQRIVVVDYTRNPTLCRYGIWVGLAVTYAQTVTFSYEHADESLYVGWRVNGTTIIDPGYSSGTHPPGNPCPGAQSVLYNCPVDNLFHRISLTSSPGDPPENVSLQVLYRWPSDANAPARDGPSVEVCLSGSEIEWPAQKLEEEAACLAALWARLRKYVEVAHVNIGDPIERLAGLPWEDAARIQAGVETLERLNAAAQPALANAITAELIATLRARMPRAKTHGEREA